MGIETFNIIPVKNKVPQIPWREFTERLQTAEERSAIIKTALEDDNSLGIVTGKISGLFVLDDDGGLDTSKYPVPFTRFTKTPRGGTHYYFRWVPELDNYVTTMANVLPKVDVRGEGGYVVNYKVDPRALRAPLAPPPAWLIRLLNRKDSAIIAAAPAVVSPIEAELESIIAQDAVRGRTPTFVRVISKLKSRGLSASDVEGLLRPWAIKYNYEKKLPDLVADLYRRYPPLIAPVISQQSIEGFLEENEKVEWICSPIISKQSIGFIAGLPGTGKTWAAIDLAVEAAKGGTWLGRFPTAESKVMYIDQERARAETRRRFRAVIKGKNIDPASLRENLQIRCGTTTRIDLQHSFDAFKKDLMETKPELIIIDSFVTFHTKEENSRTDIQEVFERIKQLRQEFGCTFLFIDHENKGAFQDKQLNEEPSALRMSGSIAKPAAAEFVLTVRRQSETESFIYHTKSTMASTLPPFLLRVSDLKEDKSEIKVEAA